MKAGTVEGRRRVLKGLGALAAAAPLAMAAGPAAAVRAVETEDYRALLDEGCGATGYHRRQLDEAAERLDIRLTAEQREAILARLLCPTCGCLLVEAMASPAPGAAF